MDEQIKYHQQDTAAIIEELLEDGSDPDALYLVEHHLSCHNFDTLEKVAIEAFKLGYEVTDPEEIDDLICCDILSEIPLDEELINTQIAQIIKLTAQFKVDYDGWGTYFEDGEEFDDEEFIEDEDNNDDQNSSKTLN